MSRIMPRLFALLVFGFAHCIGCSRSPEEHAVSQIKSYGGIAWSNRLSSVRQPGEPIVLVDLSFRDVGGIRLQCLEAMPHLRDLELAGSRGTGEGLKYVARMKELRELRVCFTEVTDTDLQCLDHMPQLQLLWISRCVNLSDAGLTHLAGLTFLTNLSLEGLNITDNGMAHLEGLVRLERLNLSHTKLTGEGLRCLRSMKHLKDLALSGTAVDDDGLKQIAGLVELQSLDLSSTRVTNRGMQYLCRLSRLTTLVVSQTQVTDAGLECLKVLPHLTVR